jgi:hypothetical protein
MRKLSTGEPCAGEPPARFGGRGESGRTLLYPYSAKDGKRKPIHGSWIRFALYRVRQSLPVSLENMDRVI